MRIVLTAFEARADVGTEAGLAWNWGRAYRALGHEVTVLTQSGSSGAAHDESWVAAGIRLVQLGGFPDTAAPHGLADMGRHLLRYGRWISAVDRWLATHRHDMLQHLSLSSVRLRWPRPPLGVVFVLGPVGGAHVPPLRGLLPRDVAPEAVRAASVPVLGAARLWDVRAHRAPDVVLSTNRESTRFARAIGLGPVHDMLTDGIDAARVAAGPRTAVPGALRLMWAGRMVGTKRPDIAVRVLRLLRDRGHGATLVMMGDGPARPSTERLVARAGLEDAVRFTGTAPWSAVMLGYEMSAVYLFTSMRDSSCPSVLEAAALGLPSVAIRHQGVGTNVPEEAAPGPGRVGSIGGLVSTMSTAVEHLLVGSTYAASSRACLEFASRQTWDRKAAAVLELVEGGAS